MVMTTEVSITFLRSTSRYVYAFSSRGDDKRRRGYDYWPEILHKQHHKVYDDKVKP